MDEDRDVYDPHGYDPEIDFDRHGWPADLPVVFAGRSVGDGGLVVPTGTGTVAFHPAAQAVRA